MPSLKETKRRIVSVKSTQKITKAMKLVSSAKFARANQNLIKSREYHASLGRLTQSFLDEATAFDPLTSVREEKKSLVLLIATDRGLCGALNSGLFKKLHNFVEEKEKESITCDYALWGRRAILWGKKQEVETLESKEKVLDKPSYEFAKEVAQRVGDLFQKEAYDRVYVCFSHFRNAISQQPKISTLLPVGLSSEKSEEKGLGFDRSFFEPSRPELSSFCLQQFLTSSLYEKLLESAASEHAARMTAMDNATNNADAVIKDLTLEYNRARQAAITKELIEITSGADALN